MRGRKCDNLCCLKQVKLLAGGEILGKGVYPVKVTVMEGDLPINTNACGNSTKS